MHHLEMSNRNLQSVAAICLLTLCHSRLIATDTPSHVAVLFDESIVASNVTAIHARANQLDDEALFALLIRWVIPSESHSLIRMNGDFTPTTPAPVTSMDLTSEHAIGGGIVSPVFDLLDVAKRSNRLGDLLKIVDAVPEPRQEEQQRAKAALKALVKVELGNTDEAVKAVDRLSRLVRTSDANEISKMWPETLVVYRCVVRKVTVPGIDDLLAFLFSQRTQRDVPANSLPWHSQIAALVGLNGHREVGAPSDAANAASELTQWIPISLRRAQTRGQCLATARWARVGSQVEKITGHNDDYLFFRIPLTGDYEVQCDVSAFTMQAMAAGTFLGNDEDRSHLWTGTFRNSASRVKSDLKFSGFDQWIHQRSVVRNNTCTTSLNGLVALTDHSPTPLDPWYAVRCWWRMHAAARDIRISGNPVIPEAVDLSAAADLRGWYPYYEVSAGAPGAFFEHLPENNSTGQIVGHSGAPVGSFCESLLAYQRPLESAGSIDYEFFYEPGKTETHPALDRMVFYLQPDGVRIHWLTDGPFDRTDRSPENMSEVLPGPNAASPLPLKPGEWNQLKIGVREQHATLQLNGQMICECEFDASNDRVFGLFHFADQTEARVRSVSMRGNWPLTLPELNQEELADPRPEQLDADLAKLEDVFIHDFAKDGFPGRFFTSGKNQPAGTVEAGSDGLTIDRPGGSPWCDTFVNLPFIVHGDFDMEVGFEAFRAVGDEHGCIMLVVELDDNKRQQCRILRIRDELQRQELHSSLSEVHQDGGRSYSALSPKKTEASSGRLRMARRGTTLYYLFAENDSSKFRVLETETISDSPSVSDGLHFHTMCNGKGETSVIWKSISIRAERLTLKPDANQKSRTNLYAMNADGSNIRLLAEPRPGYIQLGSFEWSADGRILIGDMSKGGVDTSRILLMNADGSNVRDVGEGCMPSLSEDASEIVFSQPAVGIMKMKPDGTNRAVLERSAWGVQWAPDGRTIAFASGNNIMLLDAKTGKRGPLLTAQQAATLSGIFWNFGWSGNSRSIGFKATLQNGDSSVIVIDIDSEDSLQTVFSSPLYFPEDVALSPDAKTVIFPAFTPERTRASFMFVDRSTRTPAFPFLEQFRNWSITGVDWSPDGRTIAFTATTPPATTEWPLE